MKGFETNVNVQRNAAYQHGKKDCPAMKGFETWITNAKTAVVDIVRRIAPL